jgi:hypothetical protein
MDVQSDVARRRCAVMHNGRRPGRLGRRWMRYDDGRTHIGRTRERSVSGDHRPAPVVCSSALRVSVKTAPMCNLRTATRGRSFCCSTLNHCD